MNIVFDGEIGRRTRNTRIHTNNIGWIITAAVVIIIKIVVVVVAAAAASNITFAVGMKEIR
jgi:Tfp pilus assembly protein PilO